MMPGELSDLGSFRQPPSSDNSAPSGRDSRLDLLLRLANQTFLSLPVIECYRLEQVRARSLGDEPSQLSHQACLIDWSRSSISQETQIAANKSSLLSSLAGKKGDAYQGRLVSSLLSQLTPDKQAASDGVTSSQSYLMNSGELIKSTYLSTSSLLSLIGALINVFIILIILLSTKQKRHSFLRNSNTGQNSLLLFQLSLTGLLLAGYVLFNNIEIKSQQYADPVAQGSSSFSLNDYLNLDHNLPNYQPPTRANQIIPSAGHLSALLLPPAPFTIAGSQDRRCLARSQAESKHCLERPRSAKLRISKDDEQEEGEEVEEEGGGEEEEPREGDVESHPPTVLIMAFARVNPAPESFWYFRRNPGKTFESETTTNLALKHFAGSQLHGISLAKTRCGSRLAKSYPGERGEPSESYVVEEGLETTSLYCEPLFLSFACTIAPKLINFIGSIYVWTVTALAYDRYCAIAHPLQYLRPINTLRSRTYFIAVWLMSILFSLILPLSFEQFNPHRESRQVDVPDPPMSSGSQLLGSSFSRHHPQLGQKQDCYITDAAPEFGSVGRPPEETNITDLEGSRLAIIAQIIVQLSAHLQYSSNIGLDKIAANIMDSEPASTNKQSTSDGLFYNEKFAQQIYAGLVMAHSLFSSALIVFIPLLVITICNISIYRIVKVHERRLSVNSGSNVAVSGNGPASTPQWLAHRHTQNYLNHNYKSAMFKQHEASSDDKSDDGSLVSLILAKLFHGAKTKNPVKASASLPVPGMDVNQGFLNRGVKKTAHQTDLAHEHDKNPEASLINRSRRLIMREDSFQIAARLTEQSNHDRIDTGQANSKETNSNSDLGSSGGCDTVSTDVKLSQQNGQIQRNRLKRKISDQRITIHLNRNSSFNSSSQLDERDWSNQEIENQSYDEVGSTYNSDIRPFEDGGIFNQLKMAGLSFAGIAIHELSNGTHHRTLNKSTSCSLGNLITSNLNGQQANNYASSDSRCSIESVPCNNTYRKSFVTVNSSPRQHNYIQRCATKLLDSDESCHPNGLGTSQSSSCQAPHRFSNFGTKSAIFNIVTWLTLNLLILALPQYLLFTVSLFSEYEVRQTSESFLFDPANHDQRLSKLMELLLNKNNSIRDIQAQIDGYWKIQPMISLCSIWLSYCCRIILLCIIPLNGWLYGIRSRSLRISIRMILKRYISRRQASIEISQRQRSISSMKSHELAYNNPLSWLNKSYQDVQANQRPDLGTSSSNNSNLPIHQFNYYDSLNQANSRLTCHTRSSFKSGERASADQLNMSNDDFPSKSDHLPNPESATTYTNTAKLDTSSQIRFMIDDFSVEHEASTYAACSQSKTTNSPVAGTVRSLVLNPIKQCAKLSSLKSQQGSGYQQVPLIVGTTVDKVDCRSSPGLLEKRSSSGWCNKQASSESQYSSDDTEVGYLEFNGRCSNQGNLIAPDLTGEATNADTPNQQTMQMCKSSSDFRFLITSAEHDHLVVDLDDCEVTLDSDATNDCCSEARETNELDTGAMDWCKSLKNSLITLVSGTKLALRFGRSTEHDIDKTPDSGYHANVSHNSRVSREFSSASNDDLAARARLIRSGSLNLHHNPKKRQRTGSTRNQQDLNFNATRKMRASLTLANLEGIKLDKIRIPSRDFSCSGKQKSSSQMGHFCFNSNVKGSNGTLSPAYLKPPNFLKLLLNPDNGTYSGGPALSPIKEYSTNHSYASSQSSLNNINNSVKRDENNNSQEKIISQTEVPVRDVS